MAAPRTGEKSFVAGSLRLLTMSPVLEALRVMPPLSVTLLMMSQLFATRRLYVMHRFPFSLGIVVWLAFRLFYDLFTNSLLLCHFNLILPILTGASSVSELLLSGVVSWLSAFPVAEFSDRLASSVELFVFLPFILRGNQYILQIQNILNSTSLTIT